MNDRSKVIDAIVNPSILPGFTLVSGTVAVTNANVVTVAFPARGIFFAISITGTTVAAGVVTVTAGTASVAFTAGATGNMNYLIIGSTTETYTPGSTGNANVTITPKQ